ncbi:MAG: hypothetical protein ACK59M_11095 [Pseudomonadota bacterium]
MPVFAPYEGADPLGFVIAANLHRRHLSKARRAAMVAELCNMKRGNPLLGSNPSNDGFREVSAKAAAKMMDVSQSSIERAKKRMHADPAAHAAVKAGSCKYRKKSPE